MIDLDKCPHANCGEASPYGGRCPACGWGNWESDEGGDRIVGRDTARMMRDGQALGEGVSAGTRPGYVEVRFPSKPDAATRSELKAHGFRWSGVSAYWYGLACKLPARYQSEGFKAERARLDAEGGGPCPKCGGAGIFDPDHGTSVNVGPACPACDGEGQTPGPERFTVESPFGHWKARTGAPPASGPRDPGEDAADRWNEVQA